MVSPSCTRISSRPAAANYKAEVLRRKVSTGNPSISGHIESISKNGNYRPVILAYISSANQGVKSDEYGNYSFKIKPGKHNISVRCVGYQPMLIRGIRISKSDSIRLDFHLATDTVKL